MLSLKTNGLDKHAKGMSLHLGYFDTASLMVFGEQRPVERKGDSGADAHLGDVEELQKALRRGVEAQHILAEMVEEDFARKKLEHQRHQIENHGDGAVAQAFVCPALC